MLPFLANNESDLIAWARDQRQCGLTRLEECDISSNTIKYGDWSGGFQFTKIGHHERLMEPIGRCHRIISSPLLISFHFAPIPPGNYRHRRHLH